MNEKNRRIYFVTLVIILLLLGIALAIQIRQSHKTRTRAAGETVTFSFTPAQQTIQIDNTFTISLSLDAKTNIINGLDVTFLYDVAVSDLISFQPSGQFNTELINTINSQAGTLRYAAVNTGPTEPTGIIPIGTFTFQAKSSGTGNVQIQTAQIVATGISTFLPVDPTMPGSYTVITAATPTSTPIPSLIDTESPTVTITDPQSDRIVQRNKIKTLSAIASDNVGVTRVDFSVTGKGGSYSCSDTTAPYSCSWSVPGKPNATYTISARAYDAAGNPPGVHTIQVKSSTGK